MVFLLREKEEAYSYGAKVITLANWQAYTCTGDLLGTKSFGIVVEGGNIGVMAVVNGDNDVNQLKIMIKDFITQELQK